MDFDKLRYFCKVADEQSITRAAKQLHISQPALSVAVKQVEQEVGAELFSREKRQIMLNEHGKLFYEYAVRILADYDQVLHIIQKDTENSAKALTIGVTNVEMPDFLIAEFAAKNPGILLRQVLLEKSNYETQIRTVLDAAIASFRLNDDHITCLPIYTERLYLLTNSAHSLAARDSVSIEELAGEVFVASPEEYLDRIELEEKCRLAGFTPHIGFECYPHHVFDKIAADGGVAIVPECVIRSWRISDRLRTIPILGDTGRRTLYLLYNNKRRASAEAELYLQYLKNAARS